MINNRIAKPAAAFSFVPAFLRRLGDVFEENSYFPQLEWGGGITIECDKDLEGEAEILL